MPLHNKYIYVIVTAIVCVSYYYNNLIMNVIIALSVTVFAIVSNKEFVQSIISIALNSIKKLSKLNN